jgi:hypothetical protein
MMKFGIHLSKIKDLQFSLDKEDGITCGNRNPLLPSQTSQEFDERMECIWRFIYSVKRDRDLHCHTFIQMHYLHKHTDEEKLLGFNLSVDENNGEIRHKNGISCEHHNLGHHTFFPTTSPASYASQIINSL